MTHEDIHETFASCNTGGDGRQQANVHPVPFEFEGREVRVTDQWGEPWFVLADVCRTLEITNTRNATARLDEDEKGVQIMDTPGGPQPLTIINESGLYSLILTSRKPEAKRFKKWVTSVVLPSIRKTGQYGSAKIDIDKIVEIVERVVDAKIAALLPEIAKTFAHEFAKLQVAESRFAIGDGFTAGEVIELAGITNRRGLRGLARAVTSRLERIHKRRGVPMREGRLGFATATVYDPKLCKEWLREGGKAFIERFVAERRGQGVLHLAGGRG
ncbi:MAG: Bro-N domain-containing protein [Devosia sp.]